MYFQYSFPFWFRLVRIAWIDFCLSTVSFLMKVTTMRKRTLLTLFAILISVPLAIGATEAFKRTVLQKVEFPGDKYASVLVQVDVNATGLIARHIHPGIEMTYVVKGEGDLLVEGQPLRHLKVGDSFNIPPGVPHSLQNGSEPLVLVANFVVEKDKPLSSPAP